MKILAAVMLAALFFLSGAGIADAQEPETAYVLMEADTQTVLDGKNENIRMNAGYMSKLMTILIVAEDIETGRFSPDDEFTASDTVSGMKGSVIWLESGDRITADELLKSVIIGNANDAAAVLAEASEGTIADFVKRMNSEVFDLGLRDTAFFSPYGYPDENSYTTAHDIAVICCQLTKYEFLRPYFCTWREFVKGGKTELVNENTLSRTFEPHIGFKASHSDKTGYCIAEGGNYGGDITCIAVVLGASDEDESFGTAKKMLKKGCRDYCVIPTMFPDEMLKPLRIRNGEETAAELAIESQWHFAVPKSEKRVKTAVVLPEYADAPVVRGQRVGTAAFYVGDTLIYESPIIVKSNVKKLSLKYIVLKMLGKLAEK